MHELLALGSGDLKKRDSCGLSVHQKGGHRPSMCANNCYSWTGHKPSWGLLDLAPILLGHIHF
jgi:hypothetical protein